jgi:hypothetical protein
MIDTPEEGVKLTLVSAKSDCFGNRASASWGFQLWFGVWKLSLQNVSYFRNKAPKEVRQQHPLGGNSYRWRIAAPA